MRGEVRAGGHTMRGEVRAGGHAMRGGVRAAGLGLGAPVEEPVAEAQVNGAARVARLLVELHRLRGHVALLEVGRALGHHLGRRLLRGRG